MPELRNYTDLSYFVNARNASKVSMSDFEELQAALNSRDKPDEWCCTNIAALSEKNKEVLRGMRKKENG